MAATNPISIIENKSSEAQDVNNSNTASFPLDTLFSPSVPCPPEVSLMDRMEEMNLITKKEKNHKIQKNNQ